MIGPTISSDEDYGALLVLTELLTMDFLLPSVREKGGAYGAGAGISDSGIISFYSYRDPQCDQTYENFERAIADVIDGKFSSDIGNKISNKIDGIFMILSPLINCTFLIIYFTVALSI